jgi:predicted Holliday junction resolvase-like endonuclease
MAGIVDTFQAFSGILVICPCCGELLRVAELSLRYTGKFERTVLDDLRQHEKRIEKKQEALDRQLDRFEEKEAALRQAAAERGRNRMKRLIRRIDPSIGKLKYDPQDIKVIAHPVDLIVFDGLNSGGSHIKNIIFIARSKVQTYKGMRRSLARTLEKGKFLWETVQVSVEGKVEVYKG